MSGKGGNDMVAGVSSTPMGSIAPDFLLPDVQGRQISLTDVRGENGTVVLFLCNHCPYVIAIADRLAPLAQDLQVLGIGMVGIMANDWTRYPQDSPDRMREFQHRHGFSFPYLIDESQDVARAYGAICTPDFFGYDADLRLCYRGRMEGNGGKTGAPPASRDLYSAMAAVARGAEPPQIQHPSQGCSIKWRG